jgi:uncharacterized membrane protein
MSENALFKRASTKLALMGVMSALIAATTTLAIPMPPPLSTITLAPIAIFVTGILMGPWIGLVASAIGSGIGFFAGASIGTIAPPPGFLYIFLIGIIIARAPMAFIVGFLRKVNEVVAMAVGVVIETLIFFISDWYLFSFSVAVTFTLWTLVDLIYVPITFVALKGLRKALNTTYLL